MNNNYFWLKYVVIVIVQTLLSAFFFSSPYLYITLLPVLPMLMPMETSTPKVLLICFLSGIFIDLLSSSVVGITSASFLFCAFLSKPVISLTCGNEVLSRQEDLSISRQGWSKLLIPCALLLLIFLVCYILTDAAGTRSFGFIASRLCISMAIDFILAILIILFICSDR